MELLSSSVAQGRLAYSDAGNGVTRGCSSVCELTSPGNPVYFHRQDSSSVQPLVSLSYDSLYSTEFSMECFLRLGLMILKISLGMGRGSDELLSQSGAVSNGAAMSPQPHHAADNNNDAKKLRPSLDACVTVTSSSLSEEMNLGI
ncbi:hypothetical protein WN48_01969 [Eufriesea mexicana]|nr:hypothetical protein WN48_01969 [Eufriesea mexicana]